MAVNDPLEQIQKLAELKAQGVVTPAEFEAKKAELLAEVGGSHVRARRVESPMRQGTTVSPAPIIAPPPARYVVPPPIARAEPIDELLLGRVTAADVAMAEQQAAVCADTLNRLVSERSIRQQQLTILDRKVRICRFALRIRASPERVAIGRGVVGAMFVLICGALSTVISSFIGMSASVLFSGSVFGLAAGVAIVIPALLYPSDADLQARMVVLTNQIGNGQRSLTGLIQQVAQAAQLHADALQVHQHRLRIFTSRQHQLLTRDWRLLRGYDFESFLRDVFLELGYQVTATGQAGDQGVDIVLERNGQRIAVQAKGYADNVNNKAVQEVFAGMTYHCCSRCIVITNSSFTDGAIALASKVGCRLIDGALIPNLIRGEVQF